MSKLHEEMAPHPGKEGIGSERTGIYRGSADGVDKKENQG